MRSLITETRAGERSTVSKERETLCDDPKTLLEGTDMGMILELDTLSDENLREVLAHPPLRPSRLTIDKAWHGIHYLLTQSADDGPEPSNFLLKGGSTIQSEYLSYGKARLFTCEQVRGISSGLHL